MKRLDGSEVIILLVIQVGLLAGKLSGWLAITWGVTVIPLWIIGGIFLAHMVNALRLMYKNRRKDG